MTTQHLFMFLVLALFFGAEIWWLLREGQAIDRKYGDRSHPNPPAGE